MVAPLIQALPHGTWPRMLAMLEHIAADRYRGWAVHAPEHADVLLACAAREDDIAERVATVWEVSDDAIEQMLSMVPGASAAYAQLFHDRSLRSQLELQAAAELQGEAAWNAIADGTHDTHVAAELRACAALERVSADALSAIVATMA